MVLSGVNGKLAFRAMHRFTEMEDFIAENSNDPLASGKWFGMREFLSESAQSGYGLDQPVPGDSTHISTL